MKTVRPNHVQRCPECGSLVAPARPLESIETTALKTLAIDLEGVPEDCWRFFQALFASGPRSRCTATELSTTLGVLTPTLLSRFWRAGLPSPKTYLLHARLVRVAALLEDSSVPFSRAATECGAASAQALQNRLRSGLGMSGSQFRSAYTGRAMLAEFRYKLVVPYITRLLSFHPLIQGPKANTSNRRAAA